MSSHWATYAIAALLRKEEAKVTPHGNSMLPRVRSGQTVCLRPCTTGEPAVGDVVLVRLRGNVLLHLVSAERGAGENRLIQISNNKGHVNGWTSPLAVYGVAVGV